MLNEGDFRLTTPFERFEVRVSRFGRPTTDEERVLARRALLAIRARLESGDRRLTSIIGEILEGTGGVGLDAPSRVKSPEMPSFVDRTMRELEVLFDRGRLVVEVRPNPPLPVLEPPDFPDFPSPPPSAEAADTFFDVRFVDETGQAINGLEVEMEAAGDVHDVTTNAAGVALLEHVVAGGASVAVPDVAALEKILDPRWEKPRSGKAPKQSNTVEVLFAGEPLSAVALKPAVPHTVIVKPPLGKLFAELWDKTGRVRHVQRKYTISGTASFAGTTDDQGRLLHENVFPGDYKLELVLEFFEGADKETDEYEAPLVVLPPEASAPEVRLIGAVPSVTLARIKGMAFETNKSLLLPSAVQNLARLADLYADNEPAELLVVGHADTTGEPSVNDPLSLERAKNTVAYLQDDVEPWLAMYGTSVPSKRRWGSHEDLIMIEALPDFGTKDAGEDSVRWFQQTRALDVDGIAGPETRRALITEYMSFDGTSLKKPREFDIEVTAHGCGENFPLDDEGDDLDSAPADGKEDRLDRRVELFFFDAEFGIRPPPPGENSKKGSTEYPAWRKAATLVVDLDTDHAEGLVIEWSNDLDEALPADLELTAEQGDTKEALLWAKGDVDGGFRRFVFGSILGPDPVTLTAKSAEREEPLTLWDAQVVDDPEHPPLWTHLLEEFVTPREDDGALEASDAQPAVSDADVRPLGAGDLFDV